MTETKNRLREFNAFLSWAVNS